jgi:KDO2-lipid IV(A) lauroyltransferase
MWHAMKSRRNIARRNIERCFPELSPAQHQAILKGCFRSLARTVFEIAWSWSASEARMRRLGHLEGIEHVGVAAEGGRGVLIVTAHSTCLEIGARILGMNVRASAIYRPLKSPVLEWYQNRGRQAYAETMISKRDMRRAIRLLKKGGVVWYAPDQDFGREQSAFAPFFGIETATLLATHRLPQLTGCAVVPMFPHYDEERRHYTVRILPALEGYPSENVVTDLTRVNAALEEHVRAAPDQYWWIHRRFKTRPDGEAPFYD